MSKIKIPYPISPIDLEQNRVYYSKVIGENITALMLEKEITQSDLSVISTVNGMTLHKLLKYHKYEILPNFKTLSDLSMALGVSLYDLLKPLEEDGEQV